MVKKTKTDVAEVQDAQLPAYMQEYQPENLNDGFGTDDVVVPRIKLLQGTSEEVNDFDEANSGEYWNTGADVSLGEDVEFIICSRRRRYLLMAPLDDGQGVLARSDDAITWDKTGSWKVQVDKKTVADWTIADLDVQKSGLTEWGTFDPEDENSPPAATLFYDYLVICPGHMDLGPMVLSVARSGIKFAKKELNTKIRIRSASMPLQGMKFSIASSVERNDSGQDYYVPRFRNAGMASQEEYEAACKFADMLETYVVHDEEGVIDDGDDVIESEPAPKDDKSKF